MKLSLPRRSNSFRLPSPLAETNGEVAPSKSPAASFWIALHVLCCLVSLVLGFRFSRLLFFLLFSTSAILRRSTTTTTTTLTTTTTTLTQTLTQTLTLSSLPAPPLNHTAVAVGRHGIRIRPWPHPDPLEVMRAHRIIARVQREQQLQFTRRNPRPIIVITPTYSRTFQALHLTALSHSLMLVPYPLTWIVVEAGGLTEETATLLAQSGLNALHIPFHRRMPTEWSYRHRMEAQMRLHALREVRERKLDGVVVFADDSNVHSTELFDEVQNLNWIGAVSVGILTQKLQQSEEKENPQVPVQGPACNVSGKMVGYQMFDHLPHMDTSATFVGEGATVLPMKLEWSGFVLNSRLVWKEAEGRPDWVQDLDDVGENGEEVESPLVLLKDASFVEPFGNCGKEVLLWWLRAEARSDSKFPPGWIIGPPLDIPGRTSLADAPPLLPLERMAMGQEFPERDSSTTDTSARSRHSSSSKSHERDSRGRESETV